MVGQASSAPCRSSRGEASVSESYADPACRCDQYHNLNWGINSKGLDDTQSHYYGRNRLVYDMIGVTAARLFDTD